jgi:hypothetical protein
VLKLLSYFINYYLLLHANSMITILPLVFDGQAELLMSQVPEEQERGQSQSCAGYDVHVSSASKAAGLTIHACMGQTVL